MKNPVAPRGSAQFNLRLPDKLRERIQDEATRNGRSMNTEIVTLLMESLEKRGVNDMSGVEEKLDRILALLEKK